MSDNVERFEDLIGQTIAAIEVISNAPDKDDQITFAVANGDRWRMYHSQDCCESVNIEDIAGDMADLIGSPIITAEAVSSQDETPEWAPEKPREDLYSDESFTWTFYKFATIKGAVTIRWFGTSNGYYSECVDFFKEAA